MLILEIYKESEKFKSSMMPAFFVGGLVGKVGTYMSFNTKNKLIKLLGSAQDEFDREILIRDINDNHWVGEIPLECTDM